MAFTNGDLCTPAAIFPYTSTSTAAKNLASGLVLASAPPIGVVADTTGVDVVWNDGGVLGEGLAAAGLRFVTQAADATVNAFSGKVVRLVNGSQEFAGPVVAVFALEAATTGKTGDGAVVTVDVVLFRTRSGQFVLALATSVELAPGQ